jgi:hypothetical protein
MKQDVALHGTFRYIGRLTINVLSSRNRSLAMAKKKVSKAGRDARTGQFIPISEAKRRPSTTVVETIKRPAPPKKKKK